MPLDPAQFISELSIDDPPGTDNLNEGDDQIRTTKRATQQSFPNIDAAVPQTAAQMAQMAIKNEVNTFTSNNIFTSGQTFNSNLTFELTGDRGLIWNDTGIRQWDLFAQIGGGSNDLRLRRYDAAGVFLDSPLIVSSSSGRSLFGQATLHANGDAAGPGISFASETNMGIFRLGAGQLSFAINGEEKFRIADQVISMRGGTTQLRIQDGTAAVPTISFVAGDTDTGMYRFASNVLGFSTAGVARATISNAGIRSNIAGSAGAPSYSFNDDADTGMFVILSNRLGFCAGGVEQMRIKINTINMPVLPTSRAGLSAGDCWRNPTAPGFVAIV